jgi:predicted RND superfamily exporter protein
MSKMVENINTWFASTTDFIVGKRWLIIIFAIIIFIVQGVGLTRLQFVNSNDSWLMENDPLKIAQKEFEDIFGNDEFVIVMMEAEDVFSHGALVTNRKLSKTLLKEVPLADEVYSLTDLEFTRNIEDGIEVGDLVPEVIPTDPGQLEKIRQEALQKSFLRDRLFSTDSKATIIALELKPYPVEESKLDLEYQIKITQKVREIIQRPEYSDFDIYLGGVPVMAEGEMRWVAHEMEYVMGITLLLMILLLAVIFRSFVAVIAPLSTAIISMVVVLGAFGWMRAVVQEMVLILPLLLVLVLSVGYNVHILSFFQQHFLVNGKRKEAIAHALGNSAWPILFTVLTTAIGLLSFLVVPIESIRFSGIASAGLLAIAYPLVIILTPAMLSFGKDKKLVAKKERSKWFEDLLEGLGEFVLGNKIKIIFVFILVVLVFIAFVPNLEVNTDYTRTMGTKVPYIAEGVHIAESIGSLYSYEVGIKFANPGDARQPEKLIAVEKLAEGLNNFTTFKRHSSINDILKDLNKTMQDGNEEYFRIPQNQELLAQLLLLYEMSGGTDAEEWVDYDYQRARIQIELGDFTSKDVEAQIDYLNSESKKLLPESEITTVGLAVLFAQVVNYMVEGQIWSILIALAVISLVMMVVFGSVRLGLIGMIPNITPVIISLGAMSMMDTPLHMMTMLIAPMVIGIAVDDTIHFISHFRQEFYETGSYREANRLTFRSVGRAIFLTSFIICIGFAAFLPSDMLAYNHVGLYTIIAVISALAADYFVTPILIIWFKAFGKERQA